MTTLMLVALVLLGLAVRSAYTRHGLRAWSRLRRTGAGPFTIELHRRAMLSRLGSDSLEFPQPREFRLLLVRLAGIPVWSWQCVISLPPETDARIDAVSPQEFDLLFSARFQLKPPARTAPAPVVA